VLRGRDREEGAEKQEGRGRRRDVDSDAKLLPNLLKPLAYRRRRHGTLAV